MASLSFSAPLLATEEPVTPNEAQDIVDTFKSLCNCEVTVKTVKVAPKSHLKIVENGTETTNEDLDGFDEVTIIVLTGHGMGSSNKYGDGSAPDGVRVYLIARDNDPKPLEGNKGQKMISMKKTFQASIESLGHGWDVAMQVTAPGVIQLNRACGEEGRRNLRTLEIKMKPESAEAK